MKCERHGELARENIFQVMKLKLCNICMLKNGVKICNSHGLLTKNEVWVDQHDCLGCIFCKKIKMIHQAEKRKEDKLYKKKQAERMREKYASIHKKVRPYNRKMGEI